MSIASATRVLEKRVFGVDVRRARDGVTHHDRHHPRLDELDDPAEGLRMLHLVAVESADEFLPGVAHDLACQRQAAQPVEGQRVQLQRTLVFQFMDDVRLHLGDRVPAR